MTNEGRKQKNGCNCWQPRLICQKTWVGPMGGESLQTATTPIVDGLLMPQWHARLGGLVATSIVSATLGGHTFYLNGGEASQGHCGGRIAHNLIKNLNFHALSPRVCCLQFQIHDRQPRGMFMIFAHNLGYKHGCGRTTRLA